MLKESEGVSRYEGELDELGGVFGYNSFEEEIAMVLSGISA